MLAAYRINAPLLKWLYAISATLLLPDATVTAQPGTTPAFVFRVDSTPPAVAFREGFRTSGENLNLLDHALGYACDLSGSRSQQSAWVSMTSNINRAELFLLRQLDHQQATQPASQPVATWLYTIRTNANYLHVENVVQQAIQAGQNNQHPYTPLAADRLQNVLYVSNIPDQAEVVSEQVAASDIAFAEPMNYTSGTSIDRLRWGAGISNPNFVADAAQTRMDNHVELSDLRNMVPPNNDPRFTSINTCFQTCDRASARQREKRSLSSPALDYCPGETTRSQAFVATEE